LFSQSFEWYDALYSSFKDYATEAELLAGRIRQLMPGARTVLDVACGTGEHARRLADTHGFQVDGIDLEPGFVDIVARKVPSGRFVQGDMRDFSLPARYDAVICLFSSIGYLTTLADLARALTCFRAHLNPGGVILVEPWLEPEAWRPGTVTLHTFESDTLTVCRLGHADVRDHISILTFHYLAATAAGIEHRTEVHELALFTRAELAGAFAAAGLAPSFEMPGFSGRGLFVARP
jgi:SAM-dependent methyltransferase